MKKVNQITAPRINKIGPMQKEPRKVKVYFKSGNSTMLLAKMDHVDAIAFEHKLVRFLKEHNSKLEGVLIQTQ